MRIATASKKRSLAMTILWEECPTPSRTCHGVSRQDFVGTWQSTNVKPGTDIKITTKPKYCHGEGFSDRREQSRSNLHMLSRTQNWGGDRRGALKGHPRDDKSFGWECPLPNCHGERPKEAWPSPKYKVWLTCGFRRGETHAMTIAGVR